MRFDIGTGAERRGAILDWEEPGGIDLSVRFEPWMVDGLKPPRFFRGRLFRRPGTRAGW